MKMVSAIWVLSALAMLVADARTGASQQKDVENQRCYQCTHASNATNCDQLEELVPVTCPAELPYCATIAVSPDYTSFMTCAAATQTPCTLTRKAKDTYEIICTCAGHLCNAPFTREFRNELLNFSYTNLPDNKTTALTEVFINSTAFAPSSNLYEAITQRMVTDVKMLTNTQQPVTSTVKNVDEVNAPRAEALKQEATVPPDDDEDESEGSGSFEDAKPQVPAAPAAPSSFLPANENKAIPLHVNLLATIPFISLYTVA